MNDPVEALILDLLESVGTEPRERATVLEAWRTACPRLPVWEEAKARGLVARQGSSVVVTALGRNHLSRHRGRARVPSD